MVHIIPGLDGARRAAQMGALAIVVDALRSSATLCAFCDAGAAAIHVCSGLETARTLAASLDGALLAGEKESRIPDDFDLGNSPIEARNRRARGPVVFTSSNGAIMLCAARGANAVIVGGLNNAGAVADFAQSHRAAGRDVVIIPAGDGGRECDEDMASAVVLAEVIGPDIEPAREGLLSYWKSRISARGMTDLFRQSDHGGELIALGFEADVLNAAEADISNSVPLVREYVDFNGESVALLQPAP
jgi:2-phosphosulfolactate phosphatase